MSKLVVVVTAFTVVTHLVDVVCRRHVWLGAHDAAVSKLAHTTGIGDLDPLDGIDVHAEVPMVYLVGVHAEYEGKVARHHESLDVVCVCQF